MAVIKWNGDQLIAALEEPFNQANELLGARFQQEITDPKWAWPTQPSPRDIVDTGALRNSYTGTRTRIGSSPAYAHQWNIRYAMAVHSGAVFRSGHSMPARPWTVAPLRNGDFQRAFEQLARPALERIQ